MYFYCTAYRRLVAMSHNPNMFQPHAGKMRLLRKVLTLQTRKRAAALARGDAEEAEAVDRRMFHVEKLLEELESHQ